MTPSEQAFPVTQYPPILQPAEAESSRADGGGGSFPGCDFPNGVLMANTAAN